MGIDLGSVTDAYGKSKVVQLTTSNSAILTNANASGEVFALHSIVATNFSNIESNVSMTLNKNGTLLTLSDQVRLPANTNLNLIDKTLGMYIEANDSILARAGSNVSVAIIANWNTLCNADTNIYRVTSFTANRLTATPNSAINFSISTTNIPNGTTIYYTNIGTITSNLFTNNAHSGTWTITTNAGGGAIVLSNGSYTGTIQLQARITSDNGYVLGTSPVITVS